MSEQKTIKGKNINVRVPAGASVYQKLKNVEKLERLVKATKGEEREKHLQKLLLLAKKYGVKSGLKTNI